MVSSLEIRARSRSSRIVYFPKSWCYADEQVCWLALDTYYSVSSGADRPKFMLEQWTASYTAGRVTSDREATSEGSRAVLAIVQAKSLLNRI